MQPDPTPLPPVRPTLTQVLLFLATIASTLLFYPLVQHLGQEGNPFSAPGAILDAVLFSSTLLTILVVHELGHFVAGRYYRVDVSLPYFIPAPNLLGTFGAVIRIRGAIPDRRALLVIGAAGPVAGFLVALPAVVIGVAASEVETTLAGTTGPVIGGSLLLGWVIQAVHGTLPEGGGLGLGGMAFAGWAGLFLTAFNLLPLGQLDGGHVIYALLGARNRRVSWPVVGLLLVMGATLWMGWALVCLLVLLFGFRHPPVVDPGIPLGRRHRLLATACLVILILCFAPVPIQRL